MTDQTVPLAAIIVAAADNVIRAPSNRRYQYSRTLGRVLDSTSDDSVFIADGEDWYEVTSKLTLQEATTNGPGVPSDGGIIPPVPGNKVLDLQETEGAYDGEIKIHDGSGVFARGICEWREEDGVWANYEDDSSIDPNAE